MTRWPAHHPLVIDLIGHAADRHGLTPEQVRARTLRPVVVAARREVMVQLREAGWSLPEIGTALGLDHTTVHHHLRKAAATERGTGRGPSWEPRPDSPTPDRVPVEVARRMLDDLLAAGFPAAEVAQLIGSPQIVLGRSWTTRKRVDALTDVWRRWRSGDLRPPPPRGDAHPSVRADTNLRCERCHGRPMAGGRWCYGCFRAHVDRRASDRRRASSRRRAEVAA